MSKEYRLVEEPGEHEHRWAITSIGKIGTPQTLMVCAVAGCRKAKWGEEGGVMPFEDIWKEETERIIEDIDGIVDDEYFYGHHGGFLTRLMETWKTADPANKRILAGVMLQIISKYELKRRPVNRAPPFPSLAGVL